MKDRFMNGLVAGIVAGFAMITINAILLFIFDFGNLKFGEIAGVLIYGRKPKELHEYLLGLLANLGYAGSVGAAFSFLLPYISKKYLWVKGIYFGVGMWFFAYAITMLFKVPGLTRISFESAVANNFSSAVYGITLAWAINKLERQEEKRATK